MRGELIMQPAEVFPPGEFLKDEIDARGWTQTDLSEIMGRPARVVNEIISAKKSITPETAKQLAEALGTSPEFWLNLESQYQLSKVHSESGAISRRAFLYDKFPVKEMIKRGWVAASDSIDVLERNFCNFFENQPIDVLPTFAHAAKRSEPHHELTHAQLAWLFQAKKLAAEQVLNKYDASGWERCLDGLKALLWAPEETRKVPRVLADIGVRFVLVEALKGSKIDGACFWLDATKPVIAMSLRHDRIDNFWFVLRHEIEHVIHRHGESNGFILDQDVGLHDEGSADFLDDEELVANKAGAEFCVPQAELSDFISRVQPMFSEKRILLFAERIQTHPGIVIGQLNRRRNDHAFLRKHLVKVSPFIVPASTYDGWSSRAFS
jgi:HTH-type transcriptional regulator / antitoxin HigA